MWLHRNVPFSLTPKLNLSEFRIKVLKANFQNSNQR